jgi:Domain of unknown function (DUF4164)
LRRLDFSSIPRAKSSRISLPRLLAIRFPGRRRVDGPFKHRVNKGSQRMEEMGADPLEPSLERMRAALDVLEAAVERRLRFDARRADANEELALMQDDRSRLAVELDGALGQNRALSAANAAAAEVLARASERIEEILRANSHGG